MHGCCRKHGIAHLQGDDRDGDAEEMMSVELKPVQPVYAEVVATEENPAYAEVSRVVVDEWPEYAQFHLDRNKLEFGAQLGEGHFGKVWKAWAIGVTNDYERTEVAVKTIREGAPIEVTTDFKKEIRTLADFDHVNIIRLLGVCLLRAPLYMITELMNKVQIIILLEFGCTNMVTSIG